MNKQPKIINRAMKTDYELFYDAVSTKQRRVKIFLITYSAAVILLIVLVTRYA